ncbi:MAG: signal peptide peptidase SppA [Myxococcales bacterium]|jgi:protease-4
MKAAALRAIVGSLSALCLLFFAPAAAAQPESVAFRAPTSGIALPPTGVAIEDQGTSPAINPAGLALVHGPSVFYLHERNIDLDLVADGLFFSVGFGGLSLGFSPQWVRTGTGPDVRKTQWTLALGSEVFSLGANLNFFQSDQSASLDALSTWDAGLLVRPWRYLSIGASVLDLDGDTVDGQRLARRYDIGIGIRPFTDRLELAADLLVDDRNGFDDARLSFALRGEPVEGLVLLVGIGTGLQLDGELVGQFGLILNAPHFGLGYALGVRDDIGRADHLVQVRLSSERYRSLPFGRRRFVVVDLERALSPPGGPLAVLVGAPLRDPYLDLLALLRRLREDARVEGIVLKVGGTELGLARYQELRGAIADLKTAGKRVVALVFTAEDGEYLLASGAERVYAVPQATFLVNGLTASSLFLREALDKLGVQIDVARVGQYKSSPDQLTRSDMSPEEREMLDAYLDTVYPLYLEAVATSRKIPVETLRQAIEKGILSAQRAKEVGLVDEIIYPDELPKRLEEIAGGTVDLVASEPGPASWPRRWGCRPKIALIDIQGLIAEGKSRPDLGGAGIAGAETIVRALEKVLRDDSYKALVLRIESGGGSTLASDLIWRAVKQVQEHKPVVVSMGDVAASGGYYIAVAGDEILAEPATVTGSIGVFALKPSFGPLLEKLGINSVILKRGESADLFALSRPWTPQEQEAVQQYVDQAYETFVDKVAAGRKLDKQRVDELGRGRIWSGVAAREVGLVDALGGLYEALERAKARAGLAGEQADVEAVGSRGGPLELSMLSSEEQERVQKLVRASGLDYGLTLLEMGSQPLSLMPMKLQVK